jgi:NADPH:quinone reductase
MAIVTDDAVTHKKELTSRFLPDTSVPRSPAMRAFAINQFGEPGSLQQRPAPEAQAGEVLVRVHAAGVNAMDPLIAAGTYQSMWEHRLPLIPGLDMSGTIEALGPGVEDLHVGDEVFGRSTKSYYGEGTFAEFATTQRHDLWPKPAALSHADAAALGTAGTAALAPVDAVSPQRGETVVIVGAAGGVGSFATQLAARTGARVIAVTDVGSAPFVRDLGATDVIDYETGDPAAAIRALVPDGVDALIDLHSDRDALMGMVGTVRRGGRVVSPLNAVDSEALAERGLSGSNVRAATDRVGELGDLVARGELRVPIFRTYALDDASDALAEQATHHSRGKLVVLIGAEG